LGRGAERQELALNPTLNHKFTSKLRQLANDHGTLITYSNNYHLIVLTPPIDEALIALNQVMTMETNFQPCLLPLLEFPVPTF
jgi:hypothetical protein